MKKILILALLIVALPAYSKHLHPEKYYQEVWCGERGGVLEYELDDGTRVDCLLPDMAVEVDFTGAKLYECVGQALYYAKKTQRKPACLLIMENPKRDKWYLKRLKYIVEDIEGFEVYTIEP